MGIPQPRKRLCSEAAQTTVCQSFPFSDRYPCVIFLASLCRTFEISGMGDIDTDPCTCIYTFMYLSLNLFLSSPALGCRAAPRGSHCRGGDSSRQLVIPCFLVAREVQFRWRFDLAWKLTPFIQKTWVGWLDGLILCVWESGGSKANSSER